ncbi:MAG: Bipolar DNA helicase, partial [Candidatus Bathyarchaeota archaeon]|nr:Bipolar DNA helicase [Candidatus Bathyarchaeota archaeon]
MSDINAEVIAVLPNKIKISVSNIDEFIENSGVERVTVGSYLQIADNDDVKLIAIIENYSIEMNELGSKKYIIDAMPLGLIEEDTFIRGGDNIAIHPKSATIASLKDIKKIYESNIKPEEKFTFSKLSQ